MPTWWQRFKNRVDRLYAITWRNGSRYIRLYPNPGFNFWGHPWSWHRGWRRKH